MDLTPQQISAPLAVGDLIAAVLPDLAQQETIWLFLHNSRTDTGNKAVRKFIGHVQPPGVRTGPKPAANHRVLTFNDVVNIIRMVLVDCGEGMEAPPAIVLRWPLLEGIPVIIGAVRTLRYAQRGVCALCIKVLAVVAGMIENAVQHDANAQVLCLLTESPEIPLAAQHGINLFVISGVISMVAVRLEYGAEIDGGNAQRFQIWEFLLYAGQIPAKVVMVLRFSVPVGKEGQTFIPVRMKSSFSQQTGQAGRACPPEAVWKDLIGHTPSEPVGGGKGGVVNCLLPRDRVALLCA